MLGRRQLGFDLRLAFGQGIPLLADPGRLVGRGLELGLERGQLVPFGEGPAPVFVLIYGSVEILYG